MNKKILKERKRKMKSNKGITLIALIITIVVLLILAAVTIGAVRDSNIIEHAQNAGSKYTIEQEKEQIGLAVSSYQIQKKIDGDAESLFYDIVIEELKNTADVTPNGDKTILTVTFRKTGNIYTVTKEGEINGQVPPSAPEEGITLSLSELTLEVGKTTTITATLTGSLKVEDIKWTITQDGEKITISTNQATCTVTGVTVGNATITASCADKTATCSVTVKEEQIATARAFDFTTFFNEGVNVVSVLSPDESEFAFFVEGEVLPLGIATEFNLSFFEENELDIVIPENMNYKKIMGFESSGDLFLLISEDGQKIYYPDITDGENKIIFAEDAYVGVDSNINASQYYQEDVYYYLPEYSWSISTGTGNQTQTQSQHIISLSNGITYLPDANLHFVSEIIYKGNVSKDEVIEVSAEGKTVAIKEGAQKFQINGRNKLYYLQDNILYDGVVSGTPTRFINTEALPE